MSETVLTRLLLAIGVGYAALAGWATANAASFSKTVADFGPENTHLVHDFAACAATFGVGLIVAALLPSWRPAAVTLAAIWTALHALSHVVDVGNARPAALGPVEAAALTLLAVGLSSLAWRCRKETR